MSVSVFNGETHSTAFIDGIVVILPESFSDESCNAIRSKVISDGGNPHEVVEMLLAEKIPAEPSDRNTRLLCIAGDSDFAGVEIILEG